MANGGSCYKVLANDYSYTVAQSMCQQQDILSYVAVASDADENTYIRGIAPGMNWLGCNAIGGNHMWTCPDGSGKTFDAITRIASPFSSYWSEFID